MLAMPPRKGIKYCQFWGWCDILFATERYQERGYDEDTYAEETDRYNNLEGALQCLIQDANFELPAQLELEIF